MGTKTSLNFSVSTKNDYKHVSKFLFIRANGLYYNVFPLKNPQICHPSDYPYGSKDLYLGIFSEIVFKVNFTRNEQNFIF